MKARDARRLHIALFIIALMSAVTGAAIIALSAVAPFVADKLREKFEESNDKRRPAVEAAKAKKAALQKEKNKLEKEKKKLNKKKKKDLQAKAKKIYEERMSEGYESSLELMQAEIKKPAKKKSAKAEKAEKAKIEKENFEKAFIQNTPIEVAPKSPVEEITTDEYDDYSSNGSLFRGISF